MNRNKNKTSFNDMLDKLLIILVILFFIGNGCTTKEKKSEECYYNQPRNCQQYLETEVKSRGSLLALDGIVVLEDWTFYLTYFDNVTKKITEKYVKVNCNCDILYFDDSKPPEMITPFN
jgi:hypothetical protein